MIVFDLQAVQSDAHGERGIARYVSDLAVTLATDFPGVVGAFAYNDRLPTRAAALSHPALAPMLRSFSELRGRRVSVLHTNSPFELLDHAVVAVPVLADRVVVSCYDLIPCVFPNAYLNEAPVRTRYRTRLGSLIAADAIVTDSLSARNDVIRLLGVSPDRVTSIGGSVGERFVPPTSSFEERITDLQRRFPDLRRAFVMVPTGADWRKNTDAVLAAFARLPERLRSEHQLVVACKLSPVQRAEFEATAEALGIADDVLFTGLVTDDDLVRLYQTAELVVFASRYEGFGLPVLEARRCGTPVICSDSSSLPEVLPDPDATFDPHDVASISATLQRALSEVSFAARLRAIPDPGFTWRTTAERLVGVYRSLRPRPAPTARRLGVVTVIPPTPSGIADHSDRLLRGVVDRGDVDVTVFTDTARGDPTPYRLAPLAVLPIAWAAGELDAVVYVVGNNVYHRSVVPMLGVVPGHVFLHDTRLDGLFGSESSEVAERWYAGDTSELGARPLAAEAVSILVQSEHAAALVRAEVGDLAPVVDIGPHLCDRPHCVGTAIDDDVWVVTAGIADDRKQTGKFVAAAEMSSVEARWAVAGLGGERFVRAGVAVVATGRLDDREFFEWLRRTTVLVQLRDTSQGESSGVVAHALAHGIPTIVSDIGALAELPDRAVVKVPVDISAADLANVIDELLGDDERRAALRVAALEYADANDATHQAGRLVEAVFSEV